MTMPPTLLRTGTVWTRSILGRWLENSATSCMMAGEVICQTLKQKHNVKTELVQFSVGTYSSVVVVVVVVFYFGI